jgi:hypothetical protein
MSRWNSLQSKSDGQCKAATDLGYETISEKFGLLKCAVEKLVYEVAQSLHVTRQSIQRWVNCFSRAGPCGIAAASICTKGEHPFHLLRTCSNTARPLSQLSKEQGSLAVLI